MACHEGQLAWTAVLISVVTRLAHHIEPGMTHDHVSILGRSGLSCVIEIVLVGLPGYCQLFLLVPSFKDTGRSQPLAAQ